MAELHDDIVEPETIEHGETSQDFAEPASHTPTAIEVEVDQDEADSTHGDNISSASTSLRSSIRNYEWNHERRYHRYGAGAYKFPNDDEEQARLDMVHYVYTLALDDNLFLAPIRPNGLRVLDIGTGTGIWAIEFGDEHHGADVIGNDLSPIQPGWLPLNVRFIIDDVESEWNEPEPYDYIHCRYMAGSIKDRPRLIKQIYDNLKLGGWVKFQETANTLYSEDDSLKPDNALVQLMEGLMEAGEKMGRTLDPAPSFKGWAEKTGFISVTEKRVRLLVGRWPKDGRLRVIGSFLARNFYHGVQGFTAKPFIDILGWSKDEVEVLNANVRRASQRNDAHAMFDFVIVTGQKPPQSE